MSLVTAPCACCTQEGGGQSRLCVLTSSSPGSGLKEGPEPTKKGPVGGSRAHPGLGPPGSLHTQAPSHTPRSWQYILGLLSLPGETQWEPQAFLRELLGEALQVSRKPGAPSVGFPTLIQSQLIHIQTPGLAFKWVSIRRAHRIITSRYFYLERIHVIFANETG